MAPRRFFERPDRELPRDARVPEQSPATDTAAQLLMLQRSAGNAAVARLMTGPARVAREDDDSLDDALGYNAGAQLDGSEGDWTDASLDELSGDEERDTGGGGQANPAAQLGLAVAARVEEKGEVASPPPAPPPAPETASETTETAFNPFREIEGETRDPAATPVEDDLVVAIPASGASAAAPTDELSEDEAAAVVSGDVSEDEGFKVSEDDASEPASQTQVGKASEEDKAFTVSDDDDDVSDLVATPVGDDASQADDFQLSDDDKSEAVVPVAVPTSAAVASVPPIAAPPAPVAVPASATSSAKASAPARPRSPAPALPVVPAAASAPAAATPAKKKGKIKRALKAVGSAFKNLGKGRKAGKKPGKPTAAELLADPSDVSEASTSDGSDSTETVVVVKRKYSRSKSTSSAAQSSVPDPVATTQAVTTAQDLTATVTTSKHPLAEGAATEETSLSEVMKYSLKQMVHDPAERLTSEKFVNANLLAYGALGMDMMRFKMITAPQEAVGSQALMQKAGLMIQAHPELARAGLKYAWGWTDEDIAKYYDAGTGGVKGTKVEYVASEQDLKRYVIKPGATLTSGDPPQPFDTSRMLSKASGPGFAIFVMDGNGNIYAGQHRVGLFHHSSFLAGRDVAAAGELKVSGGKLVEITSKSGHYEPTPEHTLQMLKELAAHGVPLGGVRVKLWLKRSTGTMTVFVDAAEYLNEPKRVKPLGATGMFEW